jgi:hypothetical protein
MAIYMPTLYGTVGRFKPEPSDGQWLAVIIHCYILL